MKLRRLILEELQNLKGDAQLTDLRASIFIDQLQPQTLAYISTWMRGTLPRMRMAAQIVEIAPGLDVEALTDMY